MRRWGLWTEQTFWLATRKRIVNNSRVGEGMVDPEWYGQASVVQRRTC